MSNRWVPGGFVGVDIFFVISGFLISTIIFQGLDEGRFSFAGFYARRIRRIFPALILVLTAVAAIGWFTLMAEEYKQLGEDILAGAGFVSNILLWRQTGYFDRDSALKPLVHLWSLGIEEQYYLIWPLAVFLIWKIKFDRLKLVWSVLVISFALNITAARLSPEATFYLPHTRFWELMVGSALAYVRLYKNDDFDSELARFIPISSWKKHLQEIKAWTGLLSVAAGVALVNKGSAFPGWWALFPTLGTLLLISAGETAWINCKLLSNRVLVFVGLISYPLYLWHWPLLSFLRIVLGEPPAWATLAGMLLALVLAYMTYEFLERPFRRGRNLIRQGLAVPLLLSAMTAVVGLSALMVRGQVPIRYPEAIQQIAQYKTGDGSAISWRVNKCFLIHDNHEWKFDSICTDLEPRGTPLLFLWGDSHAADLYPGLHQLQSRYRFRIAEYTAAGCLPVINFKFPATEKDCQEINDSAWRKIVELKPDIAVLAAQEWRKDFLGIHESLSSTLAMLKKTGVKTVIVVGPEPLWQDTLARSLLLSYYRPGSLHTVPDRMSYNLNPYTLPADRELRSWVLKADAVYVSVLDVFCNQAGCMTKLQEGGITDLTAFDRHHLTDLASRYFAEQALGPLVADVIAPVKPLESAKSPRGSGVVTNPAGHGIQ